MTRDGEAAKVWNAKQWLEGMIKTGDDAWRGDTGAFFFDYACFSSLAVSRAGNAHFVCSFQIPAHLTDAHGNWHAGAAATVIDNVGAAAIMTVTGSIPISVEFNISYFSPAKHHDEVEIDARVVEQKGMVTMVAVEVRRKRDGKLVASGRQWMATARPSRLRSKI